MGQIRGELVVLRLVFAHKAEDPLAARRLTGLVLWHGHDAKQRRGNQGPRHSVRATVGEGCGWTAGSAEAIRRNEEMERRKGRVSGYMYRGGSGGEEEAEEMFWWTWDDAAGGRR